MDPTFVSTSKIVELAAIAYPSCECGAPWVEHGACGGYKPSKPVMNYGTVFFRSNDMLANLLFRAEQMFKRLRVARMRSL
jgi:hypothetical protein